MEESKPPVTTGNIVLGVYKGMDSEGRKVSVKSMRFCHVGNELIAAKKVHK